MHLLLNMHMVMMLSGLVSDATDERNVSATFRRQNVSV